jgi:heme oxygenase (biliverdin-IX-beta and delta-forming)
MLQERLKKDTRPDHDMVEELMFVQAIMNGTLSLQQYKLLLRTNYLVHEAFEALLFSRLSEQTAEEMQITRRGKLPALVKDLRELELDTPQTTAVAPADRFYDSEPSALGALYVLEGASLGGHVIVKKLATNPGLNHLNLKFHYYRIYGDDLVPNWKSFCAILNRQPEVDYPLILNGARQMFAYIATIQGAPFIPQSFDQLP